MVKLRRARDMLEAESKAPEKGYGWVATVVLKTVEWIGEILINNIPYILRSLLSEHEYREWDLDLRSNTTAFGRA